MGIEIGILNSLVKDPRWFSDKGVEILHIEYSPNDIDLLELGASSRNSLAHQDMVNLSKLRALLEWHQD